MLYMILLILFLLCLGVVASSFLAGFSAAEKRPAFYRDERFRKRMEWFLAPVIALLIGLINISLDYTMILAGPAVLVSGIFLRPVSEALIVEPIFRLYSKGKGNGKTQNG
ncbi:MAG TPA: hypothetical protein PLQ15_07405 [Syntrophales bacterium]|nr:hypothetical protein [Syntrophobacterales bacterium]HNQ02909.1 hypothetical protein [Syntrophales bacterium]HQL90413.1 hypothetical protein [Syntrophales bacterium]